MKRIKTAFIAFGLLAALTACGNNLVVPDNNEGVNTENISNKRSLGTRANDGDRTFEKITTQVEDEMRSRMEALGFTEISVEVEYNNDKGYEAEIERDGNEPMQAKVDDEINGVLLRGGEAFKQIVTKAEKLNLTSESNDQEVIKQVLEAFDLSEDYVEFDVEIKFNDGKKIDVEDKK